MTRPIRAALLALPIALVLAAPAAAAVTTTNITSPGDPTFRLIDAATETNEVTVTGTSDGTTGDLIDLRCYGSDNDNTVDPGQDVAVQADGSFSTQADLEDIADRGYACRLRAVPDGTSPDDTSRFTGPRMLPTYFSGPAEESSNPVHGGGEAFINMYADVEGLLGNWYSYEINDDPLYEGGPVNPTTLWSTRYWNGYYSIDTGHDWSSSNVEGDATALQVDGGNAWTAPDLPRLDYDGPDPEPTSLPDNTQSIEVTRSFNEGNGDFTVVERYLVYRCDDNTVFPPTVDSCDSVESTGVRLDRTKRFVNGARTAIITDEYVSVDGAAHSVDVEYHDDSNASGYPEFKLPGETQYFMHDTNDTFDWPGPGTMFIREAEYGDSTYHGAGAITNRQEPTRFLWDRYDAWYTSFSVAVPAGGKGTLERQFEVGPNSEAVEDQVAGNRDPEAAPQLVITAPANGTAVVTDNVLATGLVSDNVGVTSLKVNGVTVPVNSDGTWAHRVDLALGANVINVTASDAAGLSATASTSVTRVAPDLLASLCVVPSVKRKAKLRTARRRLSANNCRARVKRVRSKKVRKGRVIKLGAKAGQVFVPNARITVRVSRGR